MMEGLRGWIAGIIAVSFALSMAEKLVKGQVLRRIWDLAGGLVLLAAILSPLLRLPENELDFSWRAYERQRVSVEEALRMDAEKELRDGIEGAVEAYISDKAAALALSGEVQVILDGSGESWTIRRVELGMAFDERLSKILRDELGVKEEQQIWQEAQRGTGRETEKGGSGGDRSA